MAKGPRRHTSQARRRETPSTPASPPRLVLAWRRVAFLAAILYGRFLQICSCLTSWAWGQRWNIWSGVFRVATLLSVSYLVYDRIYEADATISAPASDPAFPFTYPFTIMNNSHIFAIRDVTWDCRNLRVVANGVRITGVQEVRGTSNIVQAGKSLNIDCAPIGPTSRFFRTRDKPTVSVAVLEIEISYSAVFLGVYTFHRHPPPTLFTWFADATNPQWIKGDFAK
jgi:hypothetical protein